MKSVSNILNSPARDQFPNLKAQQIYQQPQYRSQISNKLLSYQVKKRNQNEESQTAKQVKQSNSQSRYEGSFKSAYMNFSNSQNKFSQQVKDVVNLSHQIERTPIQSTKKKLLGVIGQDEVQLPPLSYGLSRLKGNDQMLLNRVNEKQTGKKLSYMVSGGYKPTKKPTNQKTIQSQFLQTTSEESNQKVLQHNRSFSPNIQNGDISDCDSPLLPIEQLPTIESSKISQKNVGMVSAYGANTHQGLVRNYNEDRVSIILNMMKPANKPQDLHWPQCSFFAIYDGHGGSQCAEFLRDNLHYYIIRDDNFPQNPQQAIKKGFEKAEKAYLEIADSGKSIEKSGSCAVCAVIIEQTCYIANVGDSRAVVSYDQGQRPVQLTVDHKPNHPDEKHRIITNGGQIYQSQIPFQAAHNKVEYITGPFRVLPGRLAVSRTMGDSEAKLPKYNGIPNVISAEPDVFTFRITDDCDYLILGCDGIFDKMSTKDVIQTGWSTYNKNLKSIHEFTGKAIEQIIKLSLQRKSFDNVTVVLVAFPALEKFISSQK